MICNWDCFFEGKVDDLIRFLSFISLTQTTKITHQEKNWKLKKSLKQENKYEFLFYFLEFLLEDNLDRDM